MSSNFDDGKEPTRASSIPAELDTLLTRVQTAAALTEAGYPTSPATLATKACRGGGPPYQMYGPRVLYLWGSSLEWAKGRLSAPVHSTSELMSRARAKQSTSDITETHDSEAIALPAARKLGETRP
jgi:hypothetical protein